MTVLYALLAVGVVGVAGLATSIRVITQYERGVIFRFGPVREAVRGPGLTMLVPVVDRLRKVSM